jgi:putrescine transport system substrate-binding protein
MRGYAGLQFARISLGMCLALALYACSGNETGTNEVPAKVVDVAPKDRVVHVFNWSDYIAPQTIANFEKETGIRVVYDTFDSNEILETKMMAGRTGYDVVVPGAAFLERQLPTGVYQKLQRDKVPNLVHADPELASRMAVHDPGNEHAVVYMWGTTGIGFNKALIENRLGNDSKLSSWRLLFDPAIVSRLADCGVAIVDAPGEVLDTMLIYLGKDPNAESSADLDLATAALLRIRRHVRYFDSSRYIEDLANGQICLALGWSGDVFQARDRAVEAGKSVEVAYIVPREGAVMWFDLLAIPADAPHVDEAHAFINYMLRPEVAASVSNYVSYANGNLGSVELLDEAIRTNPAIYPPPEVMNRLHARKAESPDYARLSTRAWTKVRTGT